MVADHFQRGGELDRCSFSHGKLTSFFSLARSMLASRLDD